MITTCRNSWDFYRCLSYVYIVGKSFSSSLGTFPMATHKSRSSFSWLKLPPPSTSSISNRSWINNLVARMVAGQLFSQKKYTIYFQYVCSNVVLGYRPTYNMPASESDPQTSTNNTVFWLAVNYPKHSKTLLTQWPFPSNLARDPSSMLSTDTFSSTFGGRTSKGTLATSSRVREPLPSISRSPWVKVSAFASCTLFVWVQGYMNPGKVYENRYGSYEQCICDMYRYKRII